jgi:hypothetical protein
MKKSTNLIASFALFTVITLVIYFAFKLVAAGYYITALIPIPKHLQDVGLNC